MSWSGPGVNNSVTKTIFFLFLAIFDDFCYNTVGFMPPGMPAIIGQFGTHTLNR